jgi:hypothetical protein
MFDVHAAALALLLWHLNLTLMEEAIDCAKLLAQPFTDGRLHQLDFIPN